MDKIISSLDIGTTKVCVVIARANEEGALEVLGVGKQPSMGLQRGMIVNIEATVRSIKKAVQEAELMAGVDVTEFHTGIAGSHIESVNSKGVIAIANNAEGTNDITREDIYRVIGTAQSISIPADREILHTIPQEFIVDGQGGILDPLGMTGVRLEVNVHLVICLKSALLNIQKVIEKAGYHMASVTLQPIASAEAILSDDEKELGALVIDIGGGTTDVLLYTAHSIFFTYVLALGGNNVTRDIAFGIRTANVSAENIKSTYGVALQSKVANDDYISIPLMGGREPVRIAKQTLATIIEARMKEILLMISKAIEKIEHYADKVGAGVILTGGACQCVGTEELTESILQQPARLGAPINLAGLSEQVSSPAFSTAIGLIRFALSKSDSKSDGYHLKGSGKSLKIGGFKKMSTRLKNFLSDFFN